CLTTALIGQVPVPPVSELAQISAAFLALTELAIGLGAGLFLQVLFAAVLMAGDRIANTAGLGLASQIDPATGTQSPVIGQVFSLFLLGIFVATDVHLLVIRVVLDSYTLVPIGAAIQPTAMLDAGLTAAGVMFYDAARLMMPVVIILLIVNIVIGVITRSAPQLNIFAFGFPLTMSVTLFLLWLTAPSLAPAFALLLDQAALGLVRLFAGLANG
ncbi:MAG: flagellar biosynthetic protein FliR, partial [Loktanella sp.]|nr:flagellar biosynthetic protein FliR [Loktanella sp.]